MNVAFIRPHSVLGALTDWNDYHLCLAQYVLESDEYVKYYKTRIERGDTVIMDNGIAEGVQLYRQQLEQAYERLEPTIIVAPDRLYEGYKSYDMTLSFAKYMRDAHPEAKIMGVPHGTTGTIPRLTDGGYEYLFGEMSLTDEIDYIGVSKYDVGPDFSRAARLERLHLLGYIKKPLHLLGLSYNDGILEPLNYGENMWHHILGIDSSHYYIHALNNLHTTDPREWPKLKAIKPKNYFEQKMPDGLPIVDMALLHYRNIAESRGRHF